MQTTKVDMRARLDVWTTVVQEIHHEMLANTSDLGRRASFLESLRRDGDSRERWMQSLHVRRLFRGDEGRQNEAQHVNAPTLRIGWNCAS